MINNNDIRMARCDLSRLSIVFHRAIIFAVSISFVSGQHRPGCGTQLGRALCACTQGKTSNQIRCGHDGRISGDDESIHKYVNIKKAVSNC